MVYLDHAATTPLRPEARDAWLAASAIVGNASSIHGAGQGARRVLEDARERLAAVLDCDPIEVVFTSGGTESVNLGMTALATVAICLGANLAIFAVINSILLRPLPFPQSDRLVTIYNTYPKAGVENDGSSVTNYYERRGNIPAFSSLSIFLYRAGAGRRTRLNRAGTSHARVG